MKITRIQPGTGREERGGDTANYSHAPLKKKTGRDKSGERSARQNRVLEAAKHKGRKRGGGKKKKKSGAGVSGPRARDWPETTERRKTQKNKG